MHARIPSVLVLLVSGFVILHPAHRLAFQRLHRILRRVVSLGSAFPPQFANGDLAVAAGALPDVLEHEVRAIYRRSPLYGKRHALPETGLGWDRYHAIPLLSKKEIVENGPCAFFDDCDEMNRRVDSDEYERESTSGTTMGPMTVIMERGWWDAQTLRAYRRSAVLAPLLERPFRKAVLAPVNCSSHLCPYSDFPFPNRWISNTIYLNLASDPMSFLDSEWDRIVQELQAVKPDLLEGEPIYLSLLARALERRSVTLPSVRAVILTYGKAARVHGRRIAEVLPVPQVDLYGSTEAGYLFVGEAFDRVFPIEENAFLELRSYTDPKRPDAGLEDTFQVIVTTRGREAMPLLRYHSGDLVRALPDGGYRILGRERDLWFRPDGRLLTIDDIDAVVPADWRVWHFCLTQLSPERWQFEYVAEESAPAGLAEALGAAVQARVQLARRKRLSPAASGKYPLFKPLAK